MSVSLEDLQQIPVHVEPDGTEDADNVGIHSLIRIPPVMQLEILHMPDE
jgi:hypothetical protein